MSEVKQEGDFKMPPKKKRGRPKKLTNSAGDVKVDLAKEKEVEEVQVEDAKVEETKVEETKVEEAKVEEAKVEEQPIVELNVQEETYTPSQEQVKEAYPENVQKLVDFMKETGGDLKDYVRLSTDYSEVDQSDLLREYYKSTKPHLNGDEIDFILEDKFSVDEDLEDEKTVKKKKLAYKEEIAKAKNFLEETKSKYYEEIKLRPNVNEDQCNVYNGEMGSDQRTSFSLF